jgi:hypothetical protein
MSIGKYKNEAALERAKKNISAKWKNVRFLLNEVYLLNRYFFPLANSHSFTCRTGGDPFEVKHTIKLGNDTSPPLFGPGSIVKDDKIGRTVVVMGFPKHLTDTQLLRSFTKYGYAATKAEVTQNPNHRKRTVGKRFIIAMTFLKHM